MMMKSYNKRKEEASNNRRVVGESKFGSVGDMASDEHKSPK